jgi:hypothetical protein
MAISSSIISGWLSDTTAANGSGTGPLQVKRSK